MSYNCKSKLKLIVQHILDMRSDKYSKDFDVHQLKTEDVSFTSEFDCSTEFEDKKVPITFGRGSEYDEYMYQSELLTSSLVFFHKGKSHNLSMFLAAMGVSITRVLFSTLMCVDENSSLSFDLLYSDIIKLMAKYIGAIKPVEIISSINSSVAGGSDLEEPESYMDDFLKKVVKDQDPN